MARIPISFYLNILAGIFVLFNHYASSETGDVALNKVTGAAGRFYTLFRDTALTFQHGCTSRLETALCGPAVDSVLPHDAAEYLRVHYCHTLAQGSGGTSSDRQSHGSYGSSDFTFMYCQLPMRPLVPRTPAKGLRQSLFYLDWSSQSCFSQVVWDRTGEVMATIGVLLLRTCASWWWFRAPLNVTGVLLVAYSALSALGYLFGTGVVVRFVFQVYMVVVVDFLRCIEWEAQRQASDLGVVMMERGYGAVKHARKCI
ncbi:hypothetical protein J3R83DRAFT_2640 [Lanmaoa asiatica]|nr:hypothetical protein J3R83DRAFT_2640 [Lanmaoa asiatica]